ncbi:hypothetical protein N7497_000988 [Penicillium chrysogenum]|nr:hypothetical protein N7497_000988 [Penicillium chrysogenum]
MPNQWGVQNDGSGGSEYRTISRPRHGPPMGGQVNGSARPWAAQGAHGPPINRLSAHNFPKQDE